MEGEEEVADEDVYVIMVLTRKIKQTGEKSYNFKSSLGKMACFRRGWGGRGEQ